MKTLKISDQVNYIGVNDRTTTKFESLWPIPLGVSYNSYLITGSEKSAIIDGVEVSHALKQIDHIKDILGDRHPDYLVINHMEPDHSGAISILRQAFPEITIVGNTQTLNMIEGFYGVTGNTLAVKDGDSLPLGDGCSLKFFLTPMVHWPETMMTYLEEEGILFSGDAFGCFGALNGAVIDSDMNADRYFPEMIRYYSCIVGKYGAFVQRALKKLSSLNIGMLCSTHGPVWKEQTAEVISLYDKLSRYEPLDNGVTIVYGSMYGNTESMAEATAEALAAAGVKDIAIHNASYTDLSYIISDAFTHKGLVIAAPTYSDGLFPPVKAALEALAVRGLKDRSVAILGSHTWAQQAVKVMGRQLEETGMTLVGDPIVSRHAPGADILEQCRSLGHTLATLL